MAVPRNTPAYSGVAKKKCAASHGYVSIAIQPKRTTQVIANAVSSLRARIAGATAMTAVQPHTAVPTASSTASRGGTPKMRQIAAAPTSATQMQVMAIGSALAAIRSEEHTSELQSHVNLVC